MREKIVKKKKMNHRALSRSGRGVAAVERCRDETRIGTIRTEQEFCFARLL